MTTGEHAPKSPLHKGDVEPSPEPTESAPGHDAIGEILATLEWESTIVATDRIMPQYDNHAALIKWLEDHREEIESKALSNINLPELDNWPGSTGFLKLRGEYGYKRSLLYNQKTVQGINDVASDIIACHLHPDRYPADTMLAEPILEIHKSIIYHINITLELLKFSQRVHTMSFLQPPLDIPPSFHPRSSDDISYH